MTVNTMGPICPSCGSLITRVVLTKRDLSGAYFVRRRACEFCTLRFYTKQPVEQLTEIRWVNSPAGSIPLIEPAQEELTDVA